MEAQSDLLRYDCTRSKFYRNCGYASCLLPLRREIECITSVIVAVTIGNPNIVGKPNQSQTIAKVFGGSNKKPVTLRADTFLSEI